MKAEITGWFTQAFYQQVVISLLGTLGSLGIAAIGFYVATQQGKKAARREFYRGRLLRTLIPVENHLDEYMTFIEAEKRKLEPNNIYLIHVVERLSNEKWNLLTLARRFPNPILFKLLLDTQPVIMDRIRGITALLDESIKAGNIEYGDMKRIEDAMDAVHNAVLTTAAELSDIELTAEEPPSYGPVRRLFRRVQ